MRHGLGINRVSMKDTKSRARLGTPILPTNFNRSWNPFVVDLHTYLPFLRDAMANSSAAIAPHTCASASLLNPSNSIFPGEIYQ